MATADRKKRLEASLQGLFSKPKKGDTSPSTKGEDAPHPQTDETHQSPEQKAPVVPETAKPETVPQGKTEPVIERVESLSTQPESLSQPETPNGKSEEISDRKISSVNITTQQEQSILPAEPVEDKRVLVFLIDGVQYGIDVSRIQTIIKPQNVFIVPNTPPMVKGLINLRGQIVAVVDLRTRFGQPSVEFNRDTRFVVVELEEAMASIVVDSVVGVDTIAGANLEKPTGMVKNIQTQYLDYIAHVDGKIILILNLDELIRVR
ncbi:MAG TPA: chemotaxis protein CheW [Anaerolineaceae bacterium]